MVEVVVEDEAERPGTSDGLLATPGEDLRPIKCAARQEIEFKLRSGVRLGITRRSLCPELKQLPVR